MLLFLQSFIWVRQKGMLSFSPAVYIWIEKVKDERDLQIPKCQGSTQQYWSRKPGQGIKPPTDFNQHAKGGEPANIWKVLSLSPLYSQLGLRNNCTRHWPRNNFPAVLMHPAVNRSDRLPVLMHYLCRRGAEQLSSTLREHDPVPGEIEGKSLSRFGDFKKCWIVMKHRFEAVCSLHCSVTVPLRQPRTCAGGRFPCQLPTCRVQRPITGNWFWSCSILVILNYFCKLVLGSNCSSYQNTFPCVLHYLPVQFGEKLETL